MDDRQRGGENALRFVDRVIGELRWVEETQDSGARRARDSFRTAPDLWCYRREEPGFPRA
jgi:hypothetical protein